MKCGKSTRTISSSSSALVGVTSWRSTSRASPTQRQQDGRQRRLPRRKRGRALGQQRDELGASIRWRIRFRRRLRAYRERPRNRFSSMAASTI
jgi:hypothetical protein